MTAVADRKPEVLHDSDEQIMWIPVNTQRYDLDTRSFVADVVTRGQAKAAALHEITSYYDWTTLRATKVWMAWDANFTDPESYSLGCWVETSKTTPGAHPYWRVEETHKL